MFADILRSLESTKDITYISVDVRKDDLEMLLGIIHCDLEVDNASIDNNNEAAFLLDINTEGIDHTQADEEETDTSVYLDKKPRETNNDVIETILSDKMESEMDQDVSYPCDQCDQSFKHEVNLQNHKVIHT